MTEKIILSKPERAALAALGWRDRVDRNKIKKGSLEELLLTQLDEIYKK